MNKSPCVSPKTIISTSSNIFLPSPINSNTAVPSHVCIATKNAFFIVR